MNWKMKLLAVWVLAIPAFTGFPLQFGGHTLWVGITVGWALYAIVVYSVLGLVMGLRTLRVMALIALAITAPVVILGAGISFAGLAFTGWDISRQAAYIQHYTRLAVTMLTVIPLAMTMVAVIPMHRLEGRILQRPIGVTRMERIALMILRVFGHVIHFVLPNIMEVVREENLLTGRSRSRTQIHGATRGAIAGTAAKMLRAVQHLGVEAICASIRFVPFWAEEIANLPGAGKSEPDTAARVDKENMAKGYDDESEK